MCVDKTFIRGGNPQQNGTQQQFAEPFGCGVGCRGIISDAPVKAEVCSGKIYRPHSCGTDKV